MHKVLGKLYPDIMHQKRVIIQQNNASPQTSKMTMDKMKELDGIELLSHPPYILDL